ncbi:YciI family protein [Nocardia cyriacigeorgica]|uniref:YciI family protein n=1 Tax=Nocardia cyriacigeorgica TaxID=135487 RepID=UPI002453956E|nr:YciI family protein [Nocardia cyriacigeorgica]
MHKYLVMVMRTPGFDPAVVEPHKQFLAELRAKGMLQETGRFTDGTGGAYIVLADSLDQAREIVYTDPVHTTGASEVTVYEWEITG